MYTYGLVDQRKYAELSEKERAIIARFAMHIRQAGTIMMPVRAALGPGEVEDAEAFNSLIERGWMLTSAAVQWSSDDHCMICGEGLRLAQEMQSVR